MDILSIVKLLIFIEFLAFLFFKETKALLILGIVSVLMTSAEVVTQINSDIVNLIYAPLAVTSIIKFIYYIGGEK